MTTSRTEEKRKRKRAATSKLYATSRNRHVVCMLHHVMYEICSSLHLPFASWQISTGHTNTPVNTYRTRPKGAVSCILHPGIDTLHVCYITSCMKSVQFYICLFPLTDLHRPYQHPLQPLVLLQDHRRESVMKAQGQGRQSPRRQKVTQLRNRISIKSNFLACLHVQ